ncbi:four helix bundle protein [Reinekea marina]|uniref:Four helix bundle protein n=1 Tax=Reinekea marina TaxID=1310421 RepID=A0ABV7WUN7_9GAMM|nr:four helix bundle protein [Reinekea marina]MDN3649234.1 four helix bundle protein [Reinekea marina]
MNFEKLDVWKASAQLSAELYIELKDLRDWGFKDQATRSGLSIPSNIAEGMSRTSASEKKRFLNITYSSAAELKTQIWIGQKVNYLDKELGTKWINQLDIISRMLTGLSRSLTEST